MTAPVQSFRRQSQAHQRKGDGTSLCDGAYTGELYAFANVAAGTTDAVIVAGVAGAKIRVLSYSISGGAAGVATVTFNSKGAGAGTAISPLISSAANGFPKENDNNGLFQTNDGEALTVNVATTIVGIRVTYILVD